ncbi:DUF4192 domain-containing protein [Gordonia phosphorivorans]|uniref:DUF4192 domain-containing protein n=1 Tax=Gordonia phosphorivorans TaxID=1056982 RepID=A0ABV6H7L8_9ACTN
MALQVTSPADIIAAAPTALGFVPEDSVIVFVCSGQRLAATARFDWDTAMDTLPEVAEAVSRRALDDMSVHIVLAPTEPISHAPHVLQLLAQLREVFAPTDIDLRSVLMTTGFTTGRWADLITGEIGTVQDWRTSTAAADAVHVGSTILGSRQEIVAAMAVLAAVHDGAELPPTHAVQQIGAALIAGRSVNNPAQLAAALSPHLNHGALRDLMMGLGTIHPDAAADLFLSMAVHARGDNRAHLLTLVATAAYVGGSGARTNIAVDESCKHTANGEPTGMGCLLRLSVQQALPPRDLADLIRGGVEVHAVTVEDMAASPNLFKAKVEELLGAA